MTSVCRLGGLVSFRTGKLNSNAAKAGGAYPFFTCSQETYRTDTYSFDTECVLLAGNNANGIYPIKYFVGRFDAYQRTYVIESLDQKRLLTRYLYYALQLQLEHLRSISTGAATKFLTLTLLNSIEIRLPPLPYQERIANILSAYDHLIENNTRRIAILEGMAKRIYEEWFVQFRFPGHENFQMVESEFGPIPETWEVRRATDVCCFVKGVEPGRKQYVTVPTKSTVPFLRVGDLSKRSSGLFIDRSLAKGNLLSQGDIAISLDGTIGIVRYGLCGAFSGGVRKVIPTDPSVGRAFVYQFLCSEYAQGHISAHANGATILHAGSSIRNLALVLPSPQLLKRFEELTGSMMDLVISLEQKNASLRSTRDLLLPKLISGELDVSKVPEPQPEAA